MASQIPLNGSTPNSNDPPDLKQLSVLEWQFVFVGLQLSSGNNIYMLYGRIFLAIL